MISLLRLFGFMSEIDDGPSRDAHSAFMTVVEITTFVKLTNQEVITC